MRYTTDGGTSWGPWSSRDGQLLKDTGPAAVWMGEVINWFVTGTNHQLYWYNGTWQPSLSGYLTSSPGAASVPGTDGIYVAVRGGNGALYRTYTSDGGKIWIPWQPWGGQILEGTGPAAVSYTGVVRYFVTGTNHALYWWESGSWHSLGGYLTSSPAAASQTTNAIDVFVVSTHSDIWSRNTTDGGNNWNPWYEVV